MLQLFGRVAQDGGFPVDEFFLHHVHRELERGSSGAFAVAGLQHEQLAFLHGELDVLHVFEVAFEDLANLHQLSVWLRQRGFERADVFGSADTGDDVFALRIDEVFAPEFVFTVGRVASESDAGTGGFARVTIDHGLHVDGSAPSGGDVVFATIHDGAVIHPRTEHSTSEVGPKDRSGKFCPCAF